MIDSSVDKIKELKMIVRKILFVLLFVLLSAGYSLASTDLYIGDINLYASKSFGNFKTELTARDGISGSRFDLLL